MSKTEKKTFLAVHCHDFDRKYNSQWLVDCQSTIKMGNIQIQVP